MPGLVCSLLVGAFIRVAGSLSSRRLLLLLLLRRRAHTYDDEMAPVELVDFSCSALVAALSLGFAADANANADANACVRRQ